MGIDLFFRNIKYLFKYNLKGMHNYANSELYSNIYFMYKNWEEVRKYFSKPKNFSVLSSQDTLDFLCRTNCSFSRFGDGEFGLIKGIKGKGLFQEYNENLALRLKEVLSSKNDKVLIGINYFYFNCPHDLNREQDFFYNNVSVEERTIVESFLSSNSVYGDSACTMPYNLYNSSFNFESYFNKFRTIWDKKDIVVVCGKTVFSKIKYNIFDNAKSITYIYGPRTNAFSSYDEIYSQCLEQPKDKLFLIILGQTATVLAYDLALKGERRAIDIGHLAKDYDYFKKQIPRDVFHIKNFFDKD